MDTPRGPFSKLRRHLRRGCDEGSASIASYVVAASVFIIGSSYLLHFVVESPGSATATMDHQALRANAQTALEVLLGTPGFPATWDTDVPAVQRLGLIEKGTTIRIDPDKFDALARGKFATASADGFIDYAEAKDALGIDGYEFHLRAYPVTAANESAAYGLEGMTTFNVAYVGHFDGGAETGQSKVERGALEALDLGFTNTTRASTTTGDVYKDTSADLRANLLAVIGPTIHETVISQGSGTKYDFYRVNATTYDPLVDPQLLPPGPDFTSAMALSSDGATLGYSKNRELRAIIGEFNVTGNAADISWYEYVDTDRTNGTYDCGDYGFVEVSYNGGTTWTRLTDTAAARSQDCGDAVAYIHGTTMERRETSFSGCACTTALLAFHWIGDNDNNIGYGWVVDDVTVDTGAGDDVMLSETFSAPEYDMLIIGSDVDHDAFTPDDIKNGVRDYVDRYGGRLLVLGSGENAQWLDRLFDAGTGGASGGVATPDTTHPLLTLPNQLSFTGYTAPQTLSFTSEESTLFSMVMGSSATTQTLSVSRAGAWASGGSADGAVVITSFEPHAWNAEEQRMFFANVAIYGKYHYLFLEVGPEVPTNEAVASVARSATMNKYRTGEANYTEMAFILYLWPGASSEETLAISAITPTAPRNVAVTSSAANAWVNWSFPVSNGTSAITEFEVWRGHGPTTIAGPPVKTIPITANTWSYSFQDSNVTDGLTYYYNVTAKSAAGRGTPSAVNSTTPLVLPDAPTAAASSQEGYVRVSWNNPGTATSGTILGYRVTVSDDGSTYSTVAEVGNVSSYDHVTGDTVARYYKVEALNARGYGAISSATAATAAQDAPVIGGPLLTVSRSATPNNLTLTWVAPDLLGQTLDHWNIWRSETEEGTYALLAQSTPGNTTWQDSELGAEATYWYKVQGVTTVATGLNSSADSATTAGLATAPTGFSVSNATAGQLSLGWLPPADLNGGSLAGYRVYRSTDNAAWTLLYEADALNVSYIDAGLGVNATRYYRVQAVTDVGGGEYATSSAAKTKAAPDTPIGVSAVAVLGTTTVTWSAPYSDASITHYEVWRSDTQGGTYAQRSPDPAVSPFVEVASGKWYKVRAVSAAGTSEFSAADQA